MDAVPVIYMYWSVLHGYRFLNFPWFSLPAAVLCRHPCRGQQWWPLPSISNYNHCNPMSFLIHNFTMSHCDFTGKWREGREGVEKWVFQVGNRKSYYAYRSSTLTVFPPNPPLVCSLCTHRYMLCQHAHLLYLILLCFRSFVPTVCSLWPAFCTLESRVYPRRYVCLSEF